MKQAATVTRGLVAFGLLVLIATCQPTGQTSVSTPALSSAPVEDPSLTPVPGGPTATPGEAGAFEPPAPACPSPVDEVTMPEVMASVGRAPAIVATAGPSTLVTCSTTSAFETVSSDPPVGLMAQAGDTLSLTLPAGWHLLHWSGFDRPMLGEGGNVWPGADTPDRPREIEVQVPDRSGDSIAGFTLWVISADGRVVGQLEISVVITIR
jgi:hypothetical protein